MALVRELTLVEPQRTNQHEEVHLCTYTSFDTDTGSRLFQLNTYGAKKRAHPEKVSQALQFDEASARNLIIALKDVFPSLIGL